LRIAGARYTTDVGSAKKPFSVLVGEYTALAFMLPAATFVGYAIGYLLDKAFGTHFLYIPFLILGIVAGFVQLIRQLMRDTGE
jgi:F0F1-type ATP synthase assembly protein I